MIAVAAAAAVVFVAGLDYLPLPVSPSFALSLSGGRAGRLAGWRAGGLAGWRAGGLAGAPTQITLGISSPCKRLGL